MRWIEIVQVRTGVEGGGPGLRVLKQHAQGLRGATGLGLITILKHTQYFGDIAAVLIWANDRAPVKTREGYALADAMAQYGLTDHSVWEVVTEHPTTGQAGNLKERRQPKEL